jgi:hypothetical protein
MFEQPNSRQGDRKGTPEVAIIDPADAVLPGPDSVSTEPLSGPEPPEDATPAHVRWLGYAIPISIVLVASLAIFVGYRAERHAGFAGESDQAAISASINEERLYSDALLHAQETQRNYEEWLTLSQEGFENLNPWCAPSGSAAPDPALTQTLLACELARTLQVFDLPGYAPSGSFNTSQYVDDLRTANSFDVDIDSGGHLDQASQERLAERHMLIIGMTLSLALGLCTVAQLAYRRQWFASQRYFSLWIAIPGWITAIVCVGLLVVWRA